MVRNSAATPCSDARGVSGSNGRGTFPDRTGRRRGSFGGGWRTRWCLATLRVRVLGPDAQIRGTSGARGCHNRHGMRSASAAQLASLFGSVALHACALLLMLLAARKVPPVPSSVPHERPDAWLGASAVEVDALATPEATPNVENVASSPESSSTSTSTAVTASQSEPNEKPIRPRRAKPAKPARAQAATASASEGNHEAN